MSGPRRTIVLLGMITKMPVPGVLWQVLHYLVGFRRLGYEVLYVEAHARTPSMFSSGDGDPGSRRAAAFLNDFLEPFGLGDAWAFHALHDDGACFGLSEQKLLAAYRSADLIVNLHGGTRPRPEHCETGRLVFLGTDPVQLEVELWQRRQDTRDFLDAHYALFTFGENYGADDCGLPVSEEYQLIPTRQPVVMDFWESDAVGGEAFTTVANWHQPFRQIRYRNQVYHWSKDLEFRKFIDLPSLAAPAFELALSSVSRGDRTMLEAHGWRVREASSFGSELEPYRDFVAGSRGEFTVAKDQNVRLRSGWFSDRSATYLAAGRPVITQETGFSNVLPTGEGLFGFDTLDDILAAVQTVEADYPAACQAARTVAREWFDYRVVLPRLLADLGVEGPARPHAVRTGATLDPFPAELVLAPVSRRPLRLDPDTERTLLGRALPSGRAAARPTAPPHDPDATPAASIIVVTHENLALTRLCLESLLLSEVSRPFEVVVVDNASSDGTPDYLRTLAGADPRVRVVLNPANEGFARACNVGAGVAVGGVLVFLNNDTALPPGWLDRLVDCLDDPGIGAVNAVTNRIGTEAEVPDDPQTFGAVQEVADRRAREHAGATRDVGMLAFFCLALRRDVWDEIGPLDSGFGRGLFEDDDYSARLVDAGYRLVCAQDAFVYHVGEASFGELVPGGEYGRLFAENRARFEAKWARRWERPRRGPDAPYRSLVHRVRNAVEATVPNDATVAVASRGDEALVTFENRRGWHFPRQDDGIWAGFYPAHDDEALDHLRALRRAGAEYFVLPRPAFWWLDHYPALGRHLAREGEELMSDDDLKIYRLAEPESPPGPRPVFIIGSPRSGTSVLTWSLGQHPNLYPLEETVWFGRFHRGLSEAFQLGTSRGDLSQLSAQKIDRATFMQAFGRTVDDLILAHRTWPHAPVPRDRRFARARSPHDPKARWVDGTPENSFFVAGLAELYPEARFIHLLREPGGVVRSLRGFHNIGGRAHTASDAYARWLRHVKACVSAEEALGPERLLRVYHRDLASDAESLVRACLTFLEEPWSADCLLPLERRINSSGSRPELPEGDAPDPELVAEAEALEASLFGSGVAGP